MRTASAFSDTDTATDVAIVGAGPAGLALALFLARRGIRSTLLERSGRETLAAPADDGREIALTHKSERLLRELDAWPLLRADEVGTLAAARVVDGHSPFALDFDDAGRGPLGKIVPNAALRRVLFERVAKEPLISLRDRATVIGLEITDSGRRVQFVTGDDEGASSKDTVKTVSAPLVVAADSRFSDTRRTAGIGADARDFGRTAIVGRVRTEHPHDGIARECFRYGATLALLPMADPHESSAVVTIPAPRAGEIQQMDDAAFAAYVSARSDGVLGTIESLGARHSYPLVAVYAQRFVARDFALVGDAAVGMHPVTAHGYNLGLASADTLARQLGSLANLTDSARRQRTLARYQLLHRLESKVIYEGTNRVVGLFTDDRAPAKFLRKAVLRGSHFFPPIRKAIVHQLTR